jgi:murein DD-endopeptidase MepM/ murein hydrolase activator NlpD
VRHRPNGVVSDSQMRSALPTATSICPPLRFMKIRWDGFDPPADGKALRRLSGARFGMTRTNSDGSSRGHGGIDLYAAVGTPVFAIADGIVRRVQRKSTGYGVSLLLEFRLRETGLRRLPGVRTVVARGRLFALYAHLDEVRVPVESPVRRGQLLGTTGLSGHGDQNYPHLHFEIRKVDPARDSTTSDGIADRIDPERLFLVDYVEPWEDARKASQTA